MPALYRGVSSGGRDRGGSGLHGSLGSVLQMERLLRSQSKVEHALEEIRRSMDKLPDILAEKLNAGRDSRETSVPAATQGRPSQETLCQLPKAAVGTRNGSHPTPDMLDTEEVTGEEARQQQDIAPVLSPIDRNDRGPPAIRKYASDTGVSVASSRAPIMRHDTTSCPVYESRGMIRTSTSTGQHAGGGSLATRPQVELEQVYQALLSNNFSDVQDAAYTTSSMEQLEATMAVTKFTVATSRFTIHPASGFCAFLDATRALFLLHDVIIIPYILAWPEESSSALLRYAAWCVALFWIVDLVLNFMTGFVKDGSVEMHLVAIAAQYLRRGFLVDALVVAVELVDLFTDETANTVFFVKVLRFLKLTRLIRIVTKLQTGVLARIDTLLVYWMQARGMVGSHHHLNLLITILKLLFGISWLGHVGACIRRAIDPELILGGGCILDARNADADTPVYMLSLYWSFTTMFSGASVADPRSAAEAVIAMTWLILGAVMVTSITSSLAAALVASQQKNIEARKWTRDLTSFLGQRRIPVVLGLAVRADFVKKAQILDPITELDLPLLEAVAPRLRAALREYQYTEGFLRVPFFRILNTVCTGTLEKLCFRVTSIQVARAGEEIFVADEEMAMAMMVSIGSLAYQLPSFNTGNATSRTGRITHIQVHPLSWIFEAALLLTWKSLGHAVAEGMCELLVVSTEHFIRAFLEDLTSAAFLSAYAVRLCQATQWGEISLQSDIDVEFDCDLVLCRLHSAVRRSVSLPLLAYLRRNQRSFLSSMRQKTWLDLKREVDQGICHLVMGNNGLQDIQRVVRLEVLRLTNADDLICVQLAERKDATKDGVWVPNFNLPGRKLGHDVEEPGPEPSTELLEQVFPKGKVPQCVLQLHNTTTVVENRSSDSYGLLTKYIKTVHQISFNGQVFPAPTVEAAQARHSMISGRSGRVDHALSFNSAQYYVTRVSTAISKGRSSFPSLVLGNLLSSSHHASRASYDSSIERAFDCDSNYHGFAVGNAVFAWISLTDFEDLFRKRVETEAQIRSKLEKLHHHHWLRLYDWEVRMKCSVQPDGSMHMEL